MATAASLFYRTTGSTRPTRAQLHRYDLDALAEHRVGNRRRSRSTTRTSTASALRLRSQRAQSGSMTIQGSVLISEGMSYAVHNEPIYVWPG